MARPVSTVSKQIVSCSIITRFEDGTDSRRVIKEGDTVENLRYVADGEVKTVSGHVDAFTYRATSSNINSGKNAKDTFGRDVRVTNIILDASDVYDSNIITIPVKEIVEDEGVENVIKVDNVASAKLDISITYSDGSIEESSIEPGDLVDAVVMNTARGKADITGRFNVLAFTYKAVSNAPVITGMALKNIETGKVTVTTVQRLVRIKEIPTAKINDFSEIYTFLQNAFAEGDEAALTLTGDVEVPPREDGKITSTFINAGKKLTVDLAGHEFKTKAFAFYVNGGELIISDSAGTGEFNVGMPGVAYPAIQITGGSCTMLSGKIDCTNVEVPEGSYNWMYGAVCSQDGVFNMLGGEIHTDEASGISITNGTASGAGAQFTIGGDATLIADEGPAIYNADQKTVIVQDNAVIKGGILSRLGTIIVKDNALVEDYRVSGTVDDLGAFLPQSGSISFYGYGPVAIMSGCYTSNTGDNSIAVELLGNATLKSGSGNGLVLIPLDTKMDQTVDVTIEDSVKFSVAKDNYKIYDHDELMALAEAAGTAAKVKITKQSTINVNGEQVYPVINTSEGSNEEPIEEG